jgi:acyl-coenzyme A thioesterase PaaI-like protein
MNETVRARPFTIDELRAYLVEIFPEFWKDGDLHVEDIAPMSATVRLIHHPKHLRPGGTISGPAMFAVCDAALFVAILGEIGPVAHAVTTSASINFLRKPAPADLIARTRLLKLGKRLAVGEVALYSEGESEMVAHATATYSLPARGERVRTRPGLFGARKGASGG